MEKLFDSVKELDKRAEDSFNLKNGVLMEQAARGMAEYIRRYCIDSATLQNRSKPSTLQQHTTPSTKPCVQIACGSGDNGGDGFALARMLGDFCRVRTVAVFEPKSPLCKLQRERLELLGIPVYTDLIDHCDVLVDAVFGTGIHGLLDEHTCAVLGQLNAVDGYKIACDIPSGLNAAGIPSPVAFRADTTCTMGALKTALYADSAKDYTGTIQLLGLGLPRTSYEGETNTFLLSADDMCLPHRSLQNTHKMSYGHGVFLCGEKAGACMLAASAALHFGIGLVTILGTPQPNALPDFMYSTGLPDTFSALMVGSGLGRSKTAQLPALHLLADEQVEERPLILDADILHSRAIMSVLPDCKLPILTPHPKEFQSLLANSRLAQVSVAEIQQDRFGYLRLFCTAFPHAIVVLKGAYPLIGYGKQIFVNPLGTNALAKAGTGDVLSGMITALAAQGYPPLKAAYTASLAHAQAARLLHTDYGLTASALAASLPDLCRISEEINNSDASVRVLNHPHE
ncbi:MAG: NAD(P)H-hydrate dehydratase [Treponema sp.]|uniref:NAD(P)H-hydrate dehydratase n=1 Tax=Treponema sp. TaxID=166 RepID=UPI003FA2729D